MKQHIFVLCILNFILMGCPSYDPKEGVLYIKNNSTSNVYVYVTCEEQLKLYPSLELYSLWDSSATDQSGKMRKDTIFPQYRIEKQKEVGIVGYGAKISRRTNCGDNNLRLFFISEDSLKKNDWKHIVEKNQYIKKMLLSKGELDSMDWHIIYQ